MDMNDKLRFIQESLAPMKEHTFQYICSFFGVADEGRTGKFFGTAFRCLINKKKAVITCFHVLDQAMSCEGLAVSRGYGAAPCSIGEEFLWDDKNDLVIHFLPEDYDPDDRLTYLSESRFDTSLARLGSDYLFLHGFPAAPEIIVWGGQSAHLRSFPYGAMQIADHEVPPEAGLGPNDFALYFNDDSLMSETYSQTLQQESLALPNPKGLSGSPVFRIGISGRKASEWRPEWSLLVGVVKQWDPKHKLLVATKAPCILELYRIYKELGGTQ